MIILGLTGSIGMGKSTTAKMFGELGVPVHDSDEAVHRFYRTTAVPMIEDLFPDSVVDGVVDRHVLARLVVGNPEAMKRLEGIVHPLVRADADAFLERHRITKEPLVVLDIPLLFETGGLDRVDRVAVVSAAPSVQRARVLARPGMTQEKFEAILARQTPDTEKRARADYLIDTGSGMESARRRVADIVEELTSKSSQALAGDKAEQAAR